MNTYNLTDDTAFPSFQEIDRYNDKTAYVGLETMIHLTDSLYLRISVQNESVIFNVPHDDIIYMSLCTKNCFPIYNASCRYCEDGYEAVKVQIFTAIDRLIDSMSMLKRKILESEI